MTRPLFADGVFEQANLKVADVAQNSSNSHVVLAEDGLW